MLVILEKNFQLISFYLLILLNVVRMPPARGYNGSLSDSIRTLFTGEIYPDTDTDDKNSPNVVLLVLFLSAYAMRILILIQRGGIGP